MLTIALILIFLGGVMVYFGKAAFKKDSTTINTDLEYINKKVNSIVILVLAIAFIIIGLLLIFLTTRS